MNNQDKDHIAKIKREHVRIFLRDGDGVHHDYNLRVCDLAIPSPDGKFFVVRDLTAGEKRVRELFVPVDLIQRVETELEHYWLKSNGERGEQILDKTEEETHLITEEG